MSRALSVVSAVALIDKAGRVLMQRRPEGKAMAGLWEFPEGKIESGETPEDALSRELHEELGVIVNTTVLQAGPFTSMSSDHCHLLLLLFLVRNWSGIPQPLHAEEIIWIEPAALRRLAMPPADVALVRQLENLLCAT